MAQRPDLCGVQYGCVAVRLDHLIRGRRTAHQSTAPQTRQQTSARSAEHPRGVLPTKSVDSLRSRVGGQPPVISKKGRLIVTRGVDRPAAGPPPPFLWPPSCLGLPRILSNNDSDDLKCPVYPEHHGNGRWMPAGEQPPLSTIKSLDDAFAPRIGPPAKTKTPGLAYRGGFGLPAFVLKHNRIAAPGDDPFQPISQFWKRDCRNFLFSMRMNDPR